MFKHSFQGSENHSGEKNDKNRGSCRGKNGYRLGLGDKTNLILIMKIKNKKSHSAFDSSFHQKRHRGYNMCRAKTRKRKPHTHIVGQENWATMGRIR